MSTVATQIRIDKDVKEQSSALFAELGMDMSGAVNVFLRQCIMHGGLPFAVEVPHYSHRMLKAADEARKISRDPNAKNYDSLDDLKKALES